MQIFEQIKSDSGTAKVVDTTNQSDSGLTMRITKTITLNDLVPLVKSIGIRQAVIKIDIEGKIMYW